MSQHPQPESAAAQSAPRGAEREPSHRRADAVLVPFPAAAARRPRRGPRIDEARGEILLFLGVRYERLAS